MVMVAVMGPVQAMALTLLCRDEQRERTSLVSRRFHPIGRCAVAKKSVGDVGIPLLRRKVQRCLPVIVHEIDVDSLTRQQKLSEVNVPVLARKEYW